MEKVNSISLCTLVVGLSGAPYFGVISSYMFNTSKNDTILSMIIGFILGYIIITLYLKLFNIDHNLTLINKFKKTYKKYSVIVNIIFTIITLLLYIFLAYRLTSFLSSQYLTETPKIYLQLLIIATTFYIASKGIETLSRVSTLSLIISLIIFTFDIFGLISYIEIDNYMPMFTSSINSIITSSLSYAIYFSIPTIYITTIKKNQIVDKEKLNKTFYLMYTFSFLIVFFATLTTLGIYGSDLIVLFDYPLYTVLKKITIFSFIDSIENISIMLWILYIINSSSMMLFVIINSVKETFKIKNNKYITILLFLISILIPQLFLSNNNYVETFNYLTIPLIMNIALIVIIIITLLLNKKKM